MRKYFPFLLLLLLVGLPMVILLATQRTNIFQRAQVAPTPTPLPVPVSGRITLTFDDGLTDDLTQAAPVLQKYGLSGTAYIITSCVGMTTIPNTCRASANRTYMTWDQIKTLKNTYGWEIGSHTVTHPLLASTAPNDGQPQLLTPAQITAELSQSKAALAANGIDATEYASPYGDYVYSTLAEIAKYYSSQRGFQDNNINAFPYNDYILQVKQVQGGVTVADVKTAIDQAIANRTWLILVLHDVKTNASATPDAYEYETNDLDQIASYIKSKKDQGLIEPISIRNGVSISKPNLIANSTFNNGIGDGWTTDNVTAVIKDTQTHGSYPSPEASIKFTGGAAASHLFSPAIPVVPNSTYAFKAFVNTLGQTTGEFGFYIDEYDGTGNWISGKWLGAVQPGIVSYFSINYSPTSASVSTFKAQAYLTSNSTGVVYSDNYQLYNMTTTQGEQILTPTLTLIPTSVPTSAPTPTSIIPTWYCAGGINCVPSTSPTPVITGPTLPAEASPTTPVTQSPTSPVTVSPTSDPCATQTVREDRSKKHKPKHKKHKKHKNGGVGNTMKFFLQFIEQLLNMLLKLLGGGTINITPPDNTTPTPQPTEIIPTGEVPTSALEPTEALPTEPDMTPQPTNIEPTLNPCVTAEPSTIIEPSEPSEEPTPTVFSEPTSTPTPTTHPNNGNSSKKNKGSHHWLSKLFAKLGLFVEGL